MSLYEIKVAKSDALKIVKENKEKHDSILVDAIDGYWIEAEKFVKSNEKELINNINKNHKDTLKRLRKDLRDKVKSIKLNSKNDLELISKKDKSRPFNYFKGKYPEDHSDDYVGTIQRLELLVDDKIELNTQEFDSYIRNKWEWRNSFLSTNSGYATTKLYVGNPVSASYSITGSHLSSF